MSVVPGSLDTDSQPPMTIPLRHFVASLGLLVAGAGLGVLAASTPSLRLAHVHLVLAGWVCITIAGAMTQFVPVWFGVSLHSKRLARLQLPLLLVGLLGLASSLGLGLYALAPAFGAVALVGFWTFAYNVGRTLFRARPLDATGRHFAFALACLLAVTVLGVLLALDFTRPLLGAARPRVVAAHATLAVFGAVLGTVAGAAYQLVTMFTQTDVEGVGARLKRAETVGYPVGVAALAAGRLLGVEALAAAGGALVAGGLLALGAVLLRRLYAARVPTTPMLRRYAVVGVALLAWGALTLPAWVADPLAPAARFGAPGPTHLLLFGAVGFVVVGTLYHVVPFVVWVHRYSDLLGLEDVPMIDDLYDARVARVDFALTLAGGGAVVAAEAFALPAPALQAGGAVALAGFCLFAANLLLVLRRHAPQSVGELLRGAAAGR
ncbi:MAG: hypothetical protein ABEJ04_01755 [Halobacteriaceae archaeon]